MRALTTLFLLALIAGTALGRPLPAPHDIPSMRPGSGSDPLTGSGLDTLRFGYFQTLGGLSYAVAGETWTFDHGAADPLEGWTVEDLSSDPGAYFRIITPGSWSGHGNPENMTFIHPPGTPWLGLFEDEAQAACYLDGIGYGNLWAQQFISPYFPLTGSGDLTIQFEYFSQLETTYDRVRTRIVFLDGSSLEVGEPIDGTHGMAAEESWDTSTITVPAAALAGQTQCRLMLSMTSDGLFSDEDGGFTSSHGAFGFGHFFAARGGARVAQWFDREYALNPNQSMNGTQTLELLGRSICVQDMNADGFDDVIVGDPYFGNGQSQEGRLLVFYGNASGIPSTPSWIYESNSAGAHLGFSVAAGFTSTLTGASILLAGAPGYASGQSGEGRLYLFNGGAGGMSASPGWTYENNIAGGALGWTVDCGDLNADGVDDLVAGAPFLSNGQTNEGRIYAWSTVNLGAPLWNRESNQAGAYLGTTLRVMTDYGGYLLSGVPYWDGTNGVNCGAVESRDNTGVVVGRVEGSQAESELGLSIAEVNDFDWDGATDIAVSAALGSSYPAVRLYQSQGVGELTLAGVLEDPTFGTDIASASHSGAIGDLVMSGQNLTTVRLLDLEIAPPIATWSERWSVAVSGTGGGVALHANGDIDNDGATDLVVGLPYYTGSGATNRGRLEVHLARDTDDWGWIAQAAPPLGSQVGVANASGYALPSGGCGLTGNLLELHDPTGHHPEGQHVLLSSPVIDVSQLAPQYRSFIAKSDAYWNSPVDPSPNGIAVRGSWSFYPWVSDCGELTWSPPDLHQPEFVYGPQGCWDATWIPNSLVRQDLANAQLARFCLELWSSCDAFDFPPGSCDTPDDVTPLFDNLWIGAIDQGSITGSVKKTTFANCTTFTGTMGNVLVRLTHAGQLYAEAWTDAQGRFAFYDLPSGLYVVAVVPPTNWFEVCEQNTQISFNGTPRNDVVFGLAATAGVIDLAVDLAAGQAKPGFDTSYGLTCSNPGTTNTAAPLTLRLPWEVSFTSCTGGGSFNASTHTVEWSSVAIPPLGSKVFTVHGQVDPWEPLGATLVSSADFGPPAGDVRPADNHATATQTVVGALDPNEKLVTPTGSIPQQQLLTYQIDFQNIGTAEATNVRIEDTLEDDLDLATLDFVSTSHAPTSVEVVGRTLVWHFDGIALPDSTSDEPGSRGFVTFTVRPKAGLPPGQEVSNRARVFFDFAPEVQTNLVSNVIQGAAAVIPPSAAPRSFSLRVVSAQPVRGSAEFELSLPAAGEARLELHDVTGRVVKSLQARATQAGSVRLRWDRTDQQGRPAPAGVYFARAEWSGARRNVKATERIVIVP